MPAGIRTLSLRSCSVVPMPRHGLARLGDDAAAAAAFAARARDGEEALLIAQLTGAAALRTLRRLGARRRARSVTRLARLAPRNLNRGFAAVGGLLERDPEVVAKVGAALRPAAAAVAEHPAEAEDVAEAAEDVVELGEDRRVEAGRAGLARTPPRGRSDRSARACRRRRARSTLPPPP